MTQPAPSAPVSGSEPIWRLAYFSHARLDGGRDAILREVTGILAVSRRNNAAVGVTGGLLFNSGGFAQVLEGTRQAVGDTFERIQCDPRHTDVLVLAYEQVPSRQFDSWSMGFVGADLGDARLFGALHAESGFDPSRFTGNTVSETLSRLLLEEEARV